MPRKLRQLRADLRRLGAQITTQVGSHEKWKHPLVKDFYVQLAGADGDDAKPYQDKISAHSPEQFGGGRD